MWIKRRHKLIFKVLKGPFKIFLKIKYNYKAINVKLEKKPYLILSNHLTTMDPFMVAASFSRPIYYITNADLFSSKYGKIINYLVAPIPKNKNVKEFGPIKDCLRIVKEGGTIGIFPEGNRSYDGNLCYIDSAIAKLVKLLKIDVVLYNIHGGYGIDPRWCYKARKGKSYGQVKRILTKEEISQMSVEELFEVIKQELTVSQVPTTFRYKSKNNALGLERILYVCPVCGAIQTIETNGHNVKCNKCNLEVNYNEYLEFSSNHPQFNFKYVKDWYQFQINWVKKYDINNPETIFEDNVKLYLVPFKQRPQEILCGKLMMNNQKLIFVTEGETKMFDLMDISDTTVLGKNKLNFYINGITYQIKGEKTLNVLKYMHMYYHIKNTLGGNVNDFMGM